MKKLTKTAPAKDIDDYLASVPVEARAVLEKLRRTIRDAAPMATEKISWGMPAFYYKGPLVSFGAFKDHCSFFPMSVSVMTSHKLQLKRYDTSKGTVRFPMNKPLPAALVKKLVKARIKENEARVRNRAK
jgi:uncharacterized protein YdhG (YjbR/CyaY superfamily)